MLSTLKILFELFANTLKKFTFLAFSLFARNRVSLSISLKNPDLIRTKGKFSIGKGAMIYCHGHEFIIHDHVMIMDYSLIETVKGKIEIASNSTVNQFCVIRAHGKISIGQGVRIGPSTQIISLNHNFADPDKMIWKQGLSGKPIRISDNVWIGSNVVVLPGVTIGKNVVIGAGSVVTKDIPHNSIAVGNPCKVLKEFRSNI